jgi:transcription elongation factor GreA
MSTRVPMTPAGEKALRTTLDDVKKKLNAIPDKIAHAKGFGDLSENGEYTAAKQEQALLMKLLQVVNTKLRNSQVIDPKKLVQNNKVVFGTTVHLRNTANQELSALQIVGEDEADIKAGKISFSSPIGQGMIGKMQGDCIKVQTLEGVKSFQIEKVEYL